MPLELQIIRPSDFIRVGSFGKLDFESSKDSLRELAKSCQKRGISCAVLDLRDILIPDKPLLTPNELAALAGTFREAGFSRAHRLAILYRTDPHHGVRMFAFISNIQGWLVRAFDDFEKALMWLSIEGDAPNHGTVEEIPIRFGKEGGAS